MTAALFPCTAGTLCRAYASGHRMHAIHAGKLQGSPWGWRDAVVLSIDEDNIALLEYTSAPGTCTVWHHHDLSVMCPPGSSVRVHEQWHAVAIGTVVLNVHVIDGVGAAAPHSGTGSAPGTVIVADLGTGQGRAG